MTQRKFQSPCTDRTDEKSSIKIETEPPHTKENEATTPIQKYIQTPLLESWPDTSAHLQRVTSGRLKLKSLHLKAIKIITCLFKY